VFAARIVPGIAYVALPIPGLVAVEMIEPLLAALRQGSAVSVVGIKAVVNVAVEAAVSVEPRAGSDEYTAQKPVGPIVAVGCAVVGSVIEVAVGTYGRRSDVDADCDLG